MKSSAVNARISATVDEIRRPVAMYGTALGSVIRSRRSRGPTPNERAVSIATGSTSRAPYIVCTSSGQNAPKVARKTSLFSVVPRVRKSSGISAADGIGRRNSIGTRNDLSANWLDPRRIPIGTASSVAIERPSAHPRTVSPNAVQKLRVCIIDQSSLNVVVIAGRSCSEIRPARTTNCQSTRNAATDSAITRAGASRAAKPPTTALVSPETLPTDATPGADTTSSPNTFLSPHVRKPSPCSHREQRRRPDLPLLLDLDHHDGCRGRPAGPNGGRRASDVVGAAGEPQRPALRRGPTARGRLPRPPSARLSGQPPDARPESACRSRPRARRCRLRVAPPPARPPPGRCVARLRDPRRARHRRARTPGPPARPAPRARPCLRVAAWRACVRGARARRRGAPARAQDPSSQRTAGTWAKRAAPTSPTATGR